MIDLFLKIIRSLITIVLFSVIVWLRLIKDRHVVLLEDYSLSELQICVYTVLILTNLLTIYLCIKYIFNLQSKIKFLDKFFQFSVIKKLINFCNFIIDSPKIILTTYLSATEHNNYIAYKIHCYIRLFLGKIGDYLVKKQKIDFLLFFFNYIPRVITVTFFFLDILYFNKFYYFYMCLPLYLITILFKGIFYAIWIDSKTVIDFYSKYFKFELVASERQGKVRISGTVLHTAFEELKKTDPDLDEESFQRSLEYIFEKSVKSGYRALYIEDVWVKDEQYNKYVMVIISLIYIIALIFLIKTNI